MRQKQQRVQGLVKGLFSGEVVNDITNAEPDAFILTTNAGRIIHLSVRDSQGKLAISTEILRGSSAAAAGLFGGIRNVFSSSGWRKDIAAAKCTSSKDKGHRKCMVVTKQCVFQTWDLARHSAKTLEMEIDARQKVLDAVSPNSNLDVHDELEVFDFEVFPRDRKPRLDSQHLLLLCGLKSTKSMQYCLVDVRICEGSLSIGAVRSINCWDQGPEDNKSWLAARPRILLPYPSNTAFIIFDTFFIIASLFQAEEGPSSQLQRESDLLSEPFQDILFFAPDRDFHVVGCTSHSRSLRSGGASCSLFVNNFGFVQINAAITDEEQLHSERRAGICQSKIEQAVFFGNLPTNLFDFYRSSETFKWRDDEIEQAALRVNDTILDSSSPYISTLTPSLADQLKDRSIALKELIKFTSQWTLPELVRWQLLWSAEKMAAARAIWQIYTRHLERREEQQILHYDQHIVLLRETVDMIGENYKHANQPERGETDIVRHYFIHDISNLDLLVPWAIHALTELYREGLEDHVKQALLVDQANDIQVSALEMAYRFREQNAEMYGIPRHLFQDGIYTGSYRGFPDVWTSSVENVLKVKDLAVLARECAIENGDSSEDSPGALDIAVLTKLAQDAARLCSITCQVFEERYRTLRDREGEDNQSLATKLQQEYHSFRRNLLSQLVEIELPDEGLKIAEKYEDVAALADVVVTSVNVMIDRLNDASTPEDERDELLVKYQQYQEKIKIYHDKFGLRWAQAFYSRNMRHSIPNVLKEDGPWVFEFLQSRPELLKMKWMYEIGSRKQYQEAAHDLLQMNSTEANLWNRKVELSMAKLSILAAEEVDQADDSIVQVSTRDANRRLRAIKVQERLYSYTRPLLRTALDQIAEVDLAVESFTSALKKRKVLMESLRRNLEKLVRREVLADEDLIDILTLMNDLNHMLDDENFAGQRFFLALQIAMQSPAEDPSWAYFLRQLIWRRCILHDDWEAINNTEYKSDEQVIREAEETALFKTLLAGFSDGIQAIIVNFTVMLTFAGIFDKFSPLSPSELLEGDITPATLRFSERYESAPDAVLQALCNDLTAEVTTLAKVNEKARLQLWWPGILDAVKTSLRTTKDENGAQRAYNEEEKRKIEGKLATGGIPNGLPNGVHHSSSSEAEDAEGDVPMS